MMNSKQNNQKKNQSKYKLKQSENYFHKVIALFASKAKFSSLLSLSTFYSTVFLPLISHFLIYFFQIYTVLHYAYKYKSNRKKSFLELIAKQKYKRTSSDYKKTINKNAMNAMRTTTSAKLFVS